MDTYESSTVEMDRAPYADLESQLLNAKAIKANEPVDIREKQEKESPKEASAKKLTFKKGDQALELDEDYELEFMADKRPTKLTLRELKERAAGDIAIKNRMHSLAEEKKRVQATFKEFADIAKKDPLGALEYISKRANESDSEFEYSKYLEMLAEQAEKLGQMDEKDRKAWELEKKLSKAEQDLSLKERQAAVVLRKQQLLDDYPEIGDQQLGQIVDAVLSNEELLDGIEDEHDVMNKTEELIEEILLQKDILSVINEINPAYAADNDLVFALSDQLRLNPDLNNEEDVREMLSELIGKKEQPVRRPESAQRKQDIKTLSDKVRQGTLPASLKTQSADPYELLKEKLLERKEELKKTPLYMR